MRDRHRSAGRRRRTTPNVVQNTEHVRRAWRDWARLDLRFAGRATLVRQKWAKPGHTPRPAFGGRKPMAQTASQPAATAQMIEAYVGETMDGARMGPIHWQVLALVASGYFCDVLDFTIFGALVPDLIKSGFVTQAQVPWIGSITLLGLFVGTLCQGAFTDRFSRNAVYPFTLLLFGVATIICALP